MLDIALHLVYLGLAIAVLWFMVLGLFRFDKAGWKWFAASFFAGASFVIASVFAEFWVDWDRGGDSYNSLLAYLVPAIPIALFALVSLCMGLFSFSQSRKASIGADQ